MQDLFHRLGRALVIVAVFLLMWVLNYRLGISLLGNMANRDFMSLWTGGKAVLSNTDPYAPGAWPELRLEYGSTWIRDPVCPFPLWTLVAVAPLSLLPLDAAAALLTTLSEAALILTIGIMLGSAERGPKRLGRAAQPPPRTVRASTSFRESKLESKGHLERRLIVFLVLLAAMLSRPFLTTLIHGQLAALLTASLAVGVVLYARGQSFKAGMVLSLLILKPNLPVLFLPAVALLFLVRRDWHGTLGLASGGLGLLLLAWMVQPGWFVEWLGVSEKTRVTFGMPTLWGLAFDLAPERRLTLGIALTATVTAVVLLVVAKRSDNPQLGMGLAICGSLMVTPYLWNYDQLLLLVPALIAFNRVEARSWLRVTTWFVVVLVIPWGLFWIANRRGFDALSVFVTIVTGACLFTCCLLEDSTTRSA